MSTLQDQWRNKRSKKQFFQYIQINLLDLMVCPQFFSQTFWHFIHLDVVNAVKRFFHSGVLFKSINETLITFIPKVDNLVDMTHFRPISLCNVLYKIMSKFLVKRLKCMLKFCISPC
ncbi:hypothetical protein ACH5RR_013813 [Cinchona calisaya]|uniref:Reverse transcriptase n=1 Tax=Cinchona calisaya TaxID=153742 RepID=A0ABD3A136_9GENT